MTFPNALNTTVTRGWRGWEQQDSGSWGIKCPELVRHLQKHTICWAGNCKQSRLSQLSIHLWHPQDASSNRISATFKVHTPWNNLLTLPKECRGYRMLPLPVGPEPGWQLSISGGGGYVHHHKEVNFKFSTLAYLLPYVVIPCGCAFLVTLYSLF